MRGLRRLLASLAKNTIENERKKSPSHPKVKARITPKYIFCKFNVKSRMISQLSQFQKSDLTENLQKIIAAAIYSPFQLLFFSGWPTFIRRARPPGSATARLVCMSVVVVELRQLQLTRT